MEKHNLCVQPYPRAEVDMQSIMSSLLANAAGKQAPFPPIRPTQFSSDSFIIPGEYRQESPIPSPEGDTASESRVKLYSPSEENIPSYVPCYDIHGYSSPPSYIRGDFYNLTPPESPVPSEFSAGNHTAGTEKHSQNFTIESILNTETSSTEEASDENPAIVYSALTAPASYCDNGQFRFSMTDRSVFQSQGGDLENFSLKEMYWCHVCEAFCSSMDNASRHQMGHLSKGDNCKLLRKFFDGHGYISIHKETDYLNRLKCGLCDKIVTNCFFSKHIRKHDGHICEVCGHESTSNGGLMAHMNGHIGLKPYYCKTCSRKFGDKRQLVKHEYAHTKSTNHCRFCRKMFSSKYSRTVHERMHTGINPFVCEYPGCNRSFPQKVQLNLHKSSH